MRSSALLPPERSGGVLTALGDRPSRGRAADDVRGMDAAASAGRMPAHVGGGTLLARGVTRAERSEAVGGAHGRGTPRAACPPPRTGADNRRYVAVDARGAGGRDDRDLCHRNVTTGVSAPVPPGSGSSRPQGRRFLIAGRPAAGGGMRKQVRGGGWVRFHGAGRAVGGRLQIPWWHAEPHRPARTRPPLRGPRIWGGPGGVSPPRRAELGCR